MRASVVTHIINCEPYLVHVSIIKSITNWSNFMTYIFQRDVVMYKK